jgi:hypothetical protein
MVEDSIYTIIGSYRRCDGVGKKRGFIGALLHHQYYQRNEEED